LDDECCFGKVMLGSDILHQASWQPICEQADACGISPKEFVGECVDVVVRDG
jgi:hypothetical protein